MKIYPKTSSKLEGLDKMMEYVQKYKGVELQYFDENGIIAPFDIATPVEKLMEKIPYLEEITIHPPLCYYDIELVLFKDMKIVEEQLQTLLELSKKYDIKINLLYHTEWNFTKHKELTIDKIRKLVKMIENSKVKLIFENIFMFSENTCTAFEIAKEVDSPNCGVCFDICHLYCRANIDKKNVEEYAEKYLDADLCKKYIHQVHFSDTKDGDGYLDHKKTHGRMHDNIQGVEYDYNLLKKYNMDKCNYITEISEEDYTKRDDQLQELKWLDKVANGVD